MSLWKYRHGNTTMVDYTHGSALAAGLIVVSSDFVGVVHSDLEANRLGAVDVSNGTAVYEITKSSASTVFALGAKVDYQVNLTAVAAGTGAGLAGICVKASANGDPTVWVLKQKNVS